MSVKMEWHPKLPVLILSFTGELTARDYGKMCTEREKMLAQGPEHVVILADACQFEGFSDAHGMDLMSAVLAHEKVGYVLVVLDEVVYNKLARSFSTAPETNLPVRLFTNIDTALETAHNLLN